MHFISLGSRYKMQQIVARPQARRTIKVMHSYVYLSRLFLVAGQEHEERQYQEEAQET